MYIDILNDATVEVQHPTELGFQDFKYKLY